MSNSIIEFVFEENQVRLYGTKEDPLFLLTDVAKVLGYKKAYNMAKMVKDGELVKIKVDIEQEIGLPQNRASVLISQESLCITTKGLYRVLFNTRSPIADEFTDRVIDIIDKLRTGELKLIDTELKEVKLFNTVLKQENEELKIKLDQSLSYMTVLGYILSNKLNPDDYNIKSIGRYLTKRSNELEIPIKKAIDSRYFEINSYSVLLLSEYFNQVQPEC